MLSGRRWSDWPPPACRSGRYAERGAEPGAAHFTICGVKWFESDGPTQAEAPHFRAGVRLHGKSQLAGPTHVAPGLLKKGCHYDIRGVSFDLHVPGAPFDLAERIGNSPHVVREVARLDEIVVLRLFATTNCSVRFRRDPATLEFSGYSVEGLDLVRA